MDDVLRHMAPVFKDVKSQRSEQENNHKKHFSIKIYNYFTSSLRRSMVIRLQLSVEKAMAINATEITAAIVANESV
jgi:hypothetical protein